MTSPAPTPKPRARGLLYAATLVTIVGALIAVPGLRNVIECSRESCELEGVIGPLLLALATPFLVTGATLLFVATLRRRATG